MRLRLLVVILSMFLVLPLVNSASVGTSGMTEGGVVYKSPIITFNNNTASVNSSNFWDLLDTPADISGSEFWYNQSHWTKAGSFVYYNGGNVGIGTATPETELEVQGVIHITDPDSTRYFMEVYSVGGSGWIDSYDSTGNDYQDLVLRADDFIFDGGNVGIGTTSPDAILHINASVAPSIRLSFTDNTSYGGINFYEGATKRGAFLFQGSDYATPSRKGDLNFQQWGVVGDIKFWVQAGEAGEQIPLTITHNGSIGIGTQTPTGKFEIKSDHGVSSLFAYTDNNTYIRPGSITSGDVIMDVRNVGIGTVSPEGKLSILGDGSSVMVDLGNINHDLLITNHGAGNANFRLLAWAGDVYFDNFRKDGASSLGDTIFRNVWGATPTNVQETMRILANGNVNINIGDLLMNAGDIKLGDSQKIYFGNADDVSINFNGSATHFTNEVGSGDFIFDLNGGKLGLETGSTPLEVTLHIGSGSPNQAITEGGLYVTGNAEFDDLVVFDDYVNFNSDIFFNYPVHTKGLDFGETLWGGFIRGFDDGLILYVDDSAYNNRNFILTDYVNKDIDHDHDTTSSDPTMFFHSVTSPNNDNTEWGSISYINSSDEFRIAVGKGSINLNDSLYINGSSGNVGIGTASPTHKLNVVGIVNITQNITLGEKISFKFGEFIDNLVDGWLRITGNLNVTGNITAENVFLPSFVFAHTNNTIQVASTGVWYNITFDEEESTPKLRITHTYDDNTNDTFTIIDNGYYNIHYALSFEDATATPSAHIVTRVIKNGDEISGSLLEEDSSKQYDDFTISNGPIVYLVTGDNITFQFTADDTDVSLTSHRTYGEHHDTGVIKIIKIGN